MPFSPSAQTSKTTKLVANCDTCSKPRCIYKKTVLKRSDRPTVVTEIELLRYTWGSSFNTIEWDESSVMLELFLNQKLTCESPIEIPYYSSFENKPLCFHCGINDDLDIKGGLFPICVKCMEGGKKPQERRCNAKKK